MKRLNFATQQSLRPLISLQLLTISFRNDCTPLSESYPGLTINHFLIIFDIFILTSKALFSSKALLEFYSVLRIFIPGGQWVRNMPCCLETLAKASSSWDPLRMSTDFVGWASSIRGGDADEGSFANLGQDYILSCRHVE